MKKELTLQELLSKCQELKNRKVNIVATINDNNFSTTYGRFRLSYSNNIDWDENSYLVLDNYDSEDDKVVIKIDDIKGINLNESELGELFNVFEIQGREFILQLTLDESPCTCICCDRELDFQDRCFEIKGEGNYYTEGLDGWQINGYICSKCLMKILGNK